MTIELGQGTGPLRGVKVVEIAGIGPGPHACMILADLGADVIRVERPGGQFLSGGATMVLNRGRPSVALDLKQPEAAATVLALVAGADLLVEGMRPGVTERLGIGPEQCLAANPRLVYGRMTGWGQDGPLSQAAGHDMNYISVAGALFGMGQTPDRPQFPANLVGDFGGGSTYLVIGLLAALLEARVSGQGQVVDAAIVDGVSLLGTFLHGVRAAGDWSDERESNLIDGGAHMYDCYETADGRHLAVGAIEEKFYAELAAGLGIDRDEMPPPGERTRWPDMHDRIAAIFRTRTLADWCDVFVGLDACVTPVLTMDEATEHPHLRGRRVFQEIDGVVQPSPAPRFSRTPAATPRGSAEPGADTHEVLKAAGLSDDEIDELRSSGAIA
jgi:alpha-methylacyl-CoA racemase